MMIPASCLIVIGHFYTGINVVIEHISVQLLYDDCFMRDKYVTSFVCRV